MRHAVILAGGKGTRLASRLNGLPKPLVSIAGQPLLQRQILSLKEAKVESVTILVNHKAEVIEAFCRDNDNFGLQITLIDDGEPRGTAGAMLAALDKFPTEADDLLVIYGDTLFNIDFDRLFGFHEQHNGAATVFLHPNDHPADSDLVSLDAKNCITAVHPYPHPEGAEYQNLVNAALYVIRRSALEPWTALTEPPVRIIDIAKDLFPKMLENGQELFGYNSPEYIKDTGTPARLDKAEAVIASGKFAEGSLKTSKGAIFLDRDGVINEEVGFLSKKEDFTLLPGAVDAIKAINNSGLLAVVITNQPVIARGECSEDELAAIHAKMDTLLGVEGAYVDRLYYCPHHPDKGFEGERAELKIHCKCRKPHIGMLEQAKADLNIDFAKSWFIGDRTTDIMTAKNAGVRSILVKTGAAGSDNKHVVEPDFIAENIRDAVIVITETGAKRGAK